MVTRRNEKRRTAAHKRRSIADKARAIEYRKGIDQNSILSGTYDRLEPYIGAQSAHGVTNMADWFLPGYGAAATGEDSLDILREADSFGDYAMGGALGALALAEMVPIAGKLAKPVSRAVKGGLKGAAPDVMRFMADEYGGVGVPGRGAVQRGADALPEELARRSPTGGFAGRERSLPAFETAGSGADSAARTTLSRDGLPIFETPSDLDAFHASQQAARESRGGLGLSVDVYPPDQLTGAKAFQTPGGGASFVVQPSGELASVVSHSGTGPKGIGRDILQASSEQGADWLQAFEGLTPTYGREGYRPVARLPFNRDMMVADHGEDAVKAFQSAQTGRPDPDLVFMARDPSYTGRVQPGSGGTRFDDWGDAENRLMSEVDRLKTRRTPTDATYVAPGATGRVDGSLANPNEIAVTWQGKTPDQWTPQEWGDFGRAHDVPNLGPANADEWQKGLRTYQTDGGEVSIPAGDAPFTYYDMLHIKSQGIDPNKIPPELHDEIHRRMVAGVSQGELSDEVVANGLLMGALSPNNPLTPNELAMQRGMVKGPQDLQRWGEFAGYDYKTDAVPTQTQRQATSRGITPQLGLQAKEEGGLGVSGSANYTDLSEAMQKVRDRPDFFRFDTRNYPADMSDTEKWTQFVTEVTNELRGQGFKTTPFSTVWQDPQKASISAIDRHMATLFKDEMFPDAKAREAFHKRVIGKHNAKYPDRPVKTWEDFNAAKGARGTYVDELMSELGRRPGFKTRQAKTGEFNPRVPEYLQKTDWVGAEPADLEMQSPAMVRALEANADRAALDDLGLFSSQWKEWDKIRGRIEPHEIMFRGLEKLPRMSLDQMQGVRNIHSDLGYMTSPGNVRRASDPSKLGYFSAVPAALPLLGLLQEEEQYGAY